MLTSPTAGQVRAVVAAADELRDAGRFSEAAMVNRDGRIPLAEMSTNIIYKLARRARPRALCEAAVSHLT